MNSSIIKTINLMLGNNVFYVYFFKKYKFFVRSSSKTIIFEKCQRTSFRQWRFLIAKDKTRSSHQNKISKLEEQKQNTF